MKLYGEVKCLKVYGYTDYWNSPNLFCLYDDNPTSVSVFIDDISSPLSNYLINRSTCTDEPFTTVHKEKARMISVSELKYKHCVDVKELINKNKSRRVGYIQYKSCDQLRDLIDRINMIAELGDVKGDDLFLRFCLI